MKVTANEEMCEGNPLYSVEGAVYTVYRNSGPTDAAGSITTDKDGWGILEELEPGDYWVCEDQAGTGARDRSDRVPGESDLGTRPRALTARPYPTFRSRTPSACSSARSMRTRARADRREDATLAGALFTVRYYAGDYADARRRAKPPARPRATWVFETDGDGFAYLADEYKHSGDALYYQTNGDASIPLGTVLVQETRAPQGYNLDDGHGGAPKVFCVRITPDGAQGESVYTYNSPRCPTPSSAATSAS